MKKSKIVLLLRIVIITIVVFAYAQSVYAADVTVCSDTFTYTGNWTHNAIGACAHTYSTNVGGNTFEVSVTTSRIRIYGAYQQPAGQIKIFIGGKEVTKINTYYSGFANNGVWYDSGDIPYKTYRIIGVVEAQQAYQSPPSTPVVGSVYVSYVVYDNSTPTPTSTLVSTSTPTITPTITPTSTPLATDIMNNKDSQLEFNFWVGTVFFVSGDWLVYIVWLMLFPYAIGSNYPIQVFTVFFFSLYVFYRVIVFVRQLTDDAKTDKGSL